MTLSDIEFVSRTRNAATRCVLQSATATGAPLTALLIHSSLHVTLALYKLFLLTHSTSSDPLAGFKGALRVGEGEEREGNGMEGRGRERKEGTGREGRGNRRG